MVEAEDHLEVREAVHRPVGHYQVESLEATARRDQAAPAVAALAALHAIQVAAIVAVLPAVFPARPSKDLGEEDRARISIF